MTPTPSTKLPCEACGQQASPEHIARRLRRLEWTTRYRPLHIQALLLSSIAPSNDEDFLYAPDGQFHAEAGALLDALEMSREGKSADAVLTEFQKRGLLFIHVLECPVEPAGAEDDQGREVRSAQKAPASESGRYTEIATTLLDRQVRSTLARIRRSLKPKRVLLFSPELAALQNRFTESELGVPVLSCNGSPFQLPLPTTSRDEFLRALSAPLAV